MLRESQIAMEIPSPSGYDAFFGDQSARGDGERICRSPDQPNSTGVRVYTEGIMSIYRVFASSDGESHIEELLLEEHPALGALKNIQEVRAQQFDGSRRMDFHPLPERRLIIHLSGEVEIGASDGSRQVFRAGDIRLMEDVTGRGHTHVDLSPSSAVYVLLED